MVEEDKKTYTENNRERTVDKVDTVTTVTTVSDQGR